MKLKNISVVCLTSALLLPSLVFQARVNAVVLRIDESAFTPDAGLITFSEFPSGTFNPTYAPSDYGGGAGAPTVTFDGFFNGQTVGTPPIPPGAAASGVVNGTPTNPLTLAPNSPNTSIVRDTANPTTPVLSGSPIFNGPVSILFSSDITGVGLTGGFFNAIGGTAITAFARDGSVLGSIQNQSEGIEFLGLVTDNGLDRIAGLQFSLIGSERAGFAIDNLRFGVAGQVTPSQPVPEPSSILGTLVFGALGIGSVLKSKLKERK